jgi:hypothetical protein
MNARASHVLLIRVLAECVHRRNVGHRQSHPSTEENNAMGNNQNERGNMGSQGSGQNMGQGSGQRQEGQGKDTGSKSTQQGQNKQDDRSQDRKPGSSAPSRDDSSNR